jgi:glycosyltransferase involved in cell wall biosynthesis
VVAQDRPGVRDVLAPEAVYPSPEDGPKALAQRLDFLLSMPKLMMHLGSTARTHVRKTHMLASAARTLRTQLDEVLA